MTHPGRELLISSCHVSNSGKGREFNRLVAFLQVELFGLHSIFKPKFDSVIPTLCSLQPIGVPAIGRSMTIGQYFHRVEFLTP